MAKKKKPTYQPKAESYRSEEQMLGISRKPRARRHEDDDPFFDIIASSSRRESRMPLDFSDPRGGWE